MNLDILKQAVFESRDGITISDALTPGNPLIFVNPAFERLTGYNAEEALYRNCGYLQNDDREQSEIAVIRQAVAQGEPCLCTLRNYRKDGSLFWNELSISPIYNKHGTVTNFIGIQKDVTSRVLLDQQLRQKNKLLEESTIELAQLATRDGLTGIYNRRFFDTQHAIQWGIAMRNKDTLALFLIDVDYFKQFNDTYGHQAGDVALQSIAESLNKSFVRGSDFVARYGGEEFVILSVGLSVQQATEYTARICERVRQLNIEHPASATGHITISIGFTVSMPAVSAQPSSMIEQADKALYQAKAQGRNQAVGV
ncbi:MAG: diguanylate cyclase [Roseiflexaceae bacterium]|nr:diguanylate cyclase [Roseiflexaceae bacterium]